jgi:hypothetical protein
MRKITRLDDPLCGNPIWAPPRGRHGPLPIILMASSPSVALRSDAETEFAERAPEIRLNRAELFPALCRKGMR